MSAILNGRSASKLYLGTTPIAAAYYNGVQVIGAGGSGAGEASQVDTNPHAYWRVRDIEHTTSYFSPTNVKFLTTQDTTATAQPGPGTPLYAGRIDEGSIENAFDENGDTHVAIFGDAGAIWIGYKFDSPVVIAALLLRARADYQNQMPLKLALEFSDDGTVWALKYLFRTPMWNSFEQRRFLPANAVVAFDQPGGAKYWRYTFTRNGENGSERTFTELNMFNGQTDNAGQYTSYPETLFQPLSIATDGVVNDDFTQMRGTTNVITLEFNGKPNFDRIGLRARTTYQGQCPTQWTLAKSDDGTTFTTVLTVDDTIFGDGEKRFYPIPA